jgi:hypothetical protein
MSLMSEDYFTASTFYPITYKIIKGRPKRQQTFAEAIRSTDATNKVDYPPLSLASQSSSQISLSNKFSPLSSITENPTESGPSTTTFHYKKPNANTNNKSQSKVYQPSLTGTKQNLNKPRETNLAKSKPQGISEADRERLKSLVDDKINELRSEVKKKLTESDCQDKKVLDEFLVNFLKKQSDNRNSTPSNKGTGNLNKNRAQVARGNTPFSQK